MNSLTGAHAIARTHGCSIGDVHAALDQHPIELDRDAYLKRTLALELMRLDQLDMAFEGKAIGEHDVAAGVLLVKVAERRATLLGLNAPIGHAVAVVQHEPENKPTSTGQLRAAIDRIRRKRHQEVLPAPDQDGPSATR
jgi:hypothetical protein